MSSYKIYAKKGRKVMPIKIEQKHIYSHTFTTNSESQLYVYKPVSTNTEDNTVGYGINQNNIKVLYNTNTLTLSQGVGESQRVGNKVNIKRVAITLYVRFNSERLIAAFSHGQMIDTFFNFRIMTVHFKDLMTTNDIAKWYRETFIYYRTVSISGGTSYPYQSNWMDKLRESTPYTGSFKILFDKKFQIKKSKSVKQLNIKVPISGNVNFDNTTNRPTDNQEFNNTYTFLIGPSNVYLDMDAISTDKCLNMANDSELLFYLQSNIKITYYDV